MADGDCVIAIILASLAERGDELWGNNRRAVAHGCEEPAPVMGAGTSFHGYQASGVLSDEAGELQAAEAFLEQDLAVGVCTAGGEAVFCQVDADCSNVHMGSSSFVWSL